jgi:hypothetical protein
MASAVQLGGAPASPLFLRSGQATILQNTSAIQVVDADITNSSVVVALASSDNAVRPPTQTVSVSLEAGVGFYIRSSAVATNPGTGLVCQYAVLRY